MAAVQKGLIVLSTQLGLIELELMCAQDLLVDSPDRAAMEEERIPADLGTYLQDLLENALIDLRALRRRLEEGPTMTTAELERDWRLQRERT